METATVDQVEQLAEQLFPDRVIRIGHPTQDRWSTVTVPGEPGWETIVAVMAAVEQGGPTSTCSVEAWDDTDQTASVLIYARPGQMDRQRYERLCRGQFQDGDTSPANQRIEHALLRKVQMGPYRVASTQAIDRLAFLERQRLTKESTARYRASLRRHGSVSGAVAALRTAVADAG